jgi:hypothetical protein
MERACAANTILVITAKTVEPKSVREGKAETLPL